MLLEDSIRVYAHARKRVASCFAGLSSGWPFESAKKRIVFYGSGEVAEIASVFLQETDLTLVGVAGDRVGRFPGLPIQPIEAIGPVELGTERFDKLVVATFDQPDDIKGRLEGLRIDPDQVVWL